MIIDSVFLNLSNYTIKKALSLCVHPHQCVCICLRWVVGHLQLQAVYACPIGKVLFSLFAKRPQAVSGGYLFPLSLGTLLYGQHTHATAHTQEHKLVEKNLHSLLQSRLSVQQHVNCLTTVT